MSLMGIVCTRPQIQTSLQIVSAGVEPALRAERLSRDPIYEVVGGAVVTVAPGGSSNRDGGGDAEKLLISKLVESDATWT